MTRPVALFLSGYPIEANGVRYYASDLALARRLAEHYPTTIYGDHLRAEGVPDDLEIVSPHRYRASVVPEALPIPLFVLREHPRTSMFPLTGALRETGLLLLRGYRFIRCWEDIYLHRAHERCFRDALGDPGEDDLIEIRRQLSSGLDTRVLAERHAFDGPLFDNATELIMGSRWLRRELGRGVVVAPRPRTSSAFRKSITAERRRLSAHGDGPDQVVVLGEHLSGMWALCLLQSLAELAPQHRLRIRLACRWIPRRTPVLRTLGAAVEVQHPDLLDPAALARAALVVVLPETPGLALCDDLFEALSWGLPVATEPSPELAELPDGVVASLGREGARCPGIGQLIGALRRRPDLARLMGRRGRELVDTLDPDEPQETLRGVIDRAALKLQSDPLPNEVWDTARLRRNQRWMPIPEKIWKPLISHHDAWMGKVVGGRHRSVASRLGHP